MGFRGRGAPLARLAHAEAQCLQVVCTTQPRRLLPAPAGPLTNRLCVRCGPLPLQDEDDEDDDDDDDEWVTDDGEGAEDEEEGGGAAAAAAAAGAAAAAPGGAGVPEPAVANQQQ